MSERNAAKAKERLDRVKLNGLSLSVQWSKNTKNNNMPKQLQNNQTNRYRSRSNSLENIRKLQKRINYNAKFDFSFDMIDSCEEGEM